MNTYKKIAALEFSTFECHVNSQLESCLDALEKIDPVLLEEFHRRLYEIDIYAGSPNVANNDKCVSETITQRYWRGKDPSKAILCFFSPLLLLIFAIFSF